MFTFRRIRLSENSTNKLRAFKGRTGITPNVACRVALMLSLREPQAPSLELYNTDESGQEINREIFLGNLELPLMTLYKMWCTKNGLSQDDEYPFLMAHLNRGIERLTNRVRVVRDFDELLQESSRSHE